MTYFKSIHFLFQCGMTILIGLATVATFYVTEVKNVDIIFRYVYIILYIVSTILVIRDYRKVKKSLNK